MSKKFESLKKQLEITKEALKPDALIYEGLCSIADLVEAFVQYIEEKNSESF